MTSTIIISLCLCNMLHHAMSHSLKLASSTGGAFSTFHLCFFFHSFSDHQKKIILRAKCVNLAIDAVSEWVATGHLLMVAYKERVLALEGTSQMPTFKPRPCHTLPQILSSLTRWGCCSGQMAQENAAFWLVESSLSTNQKAAFYSHVFRVVPVRCGKEVSYQMVTNTSFF